jgi:cytochrome b561
MPKHTQSNPVDSPSTPPETLAIRLLHSMHLVVAGLFLLVAVVGVLDTQSRPNYLRTFSSHQLAEYAMDMRMMAFVSERLRTIELQRSAELATTH